MDPLHVTMTGVRMGERFLQIGCDDAALLGGLAREGGAERRLRRGGLRRGVGGERARSPRQVGALIDVRVVGPGALGVDAASVDMVVVDDTAAASRACATRTGRDAGRGAARRARRRTDRGRRTGGGDRYARRRRGQARGLPHRADLAAAGFKPVRMLAEKEGVRFLEGLGPTPHHGWRANFRTMLPPASPVSVSPGTVSPT